MRCEALGKMFARRNIDFFSGVPDSTFADWMTFLDQKHGKCLTNIIACNECEAVALVTGYHLATGKIGGVYLQNAGEGKIVNPLTSLCDPEIYSIPLLLMIGWRGEPGLHDEPQHRKMGKITLPLLDLLDIPYNILPESAKKAEPVLDKLLRTAEMEKKPVALIIRKNTLNDCEASEKRFEPRNEATSALTREDAIQGILDSLKETDILIATTGKTSRELFEYRIARGEEPCDFYTVGGMGCAAAIGFGAALHYPHKQVVVLDGDGAALMQMGSLATIGHYAPQNLFHVVLDNGAYDSTGGQPTVSTTVDFPQVALACGYRFAERVEEKHALIERVRSLTTQPGPGMLLVRVRRGARSDLGRPHTTPIQNKHAFMQSIRENQRQ